MWPINSVRRIKWQVLSALAAGAIVAAASFVTAAPRTQPLIAKIRDTVRVVDGDTIVINGQHVRLEGIDAPEAGQTCKRKWVGEWPCGRAATEALTHMLANRKVACNSVGTDKYGRTLGVCFVDGRDVNAEMVRRGLAWAFVRYSQRYVKEEAAARAGKIGIWQSETVPGWEYRSAKR